MAPWLGQHLGEGVAAGAAQGFGLGLAAPFRHRFREVGEQHGEPQPQVYLEGKAQMRGAMQPVPDEQEGGEGGDNLHHEHHRIARHLARDRAS